MRKLSASLHSFRVLFQSADLSRGSTRTQFDSLTDDGWTRMIAVLTVSVTCLQTAASPFQGNDIEQEQFTVTHCNSEVIPE